MAPFDYTTTARVFEYGNTLGTATSPVNEASVMARLITAASREIDRWCQQNFSVDTYTNRQAVAVRIDREGLPMVWVDSPTITTLVAVSFRLGASTTTLPATLTNAETTDAAHGASIALYNEHYGAYRAQTVKAYVSYTGGYANLAALPNDFVYAMDALCWWLYQKRMSAVDPQAMPDSGIVYPSQSWPRFVREMFAPYRRVVGGGNV